MLCILRAKCSLAFLPADYKDASAYERGFWFCTDVSGSGQLPRIELWAGLLDYGYNAEEIALILGIAGPSRFLSPFQLQPDL